MRASFCAARASVCAARASVCAARASVCAARASLLAAAASASARLTASDASLCLRPASRSTRCVSACSTRIDSTVSARTRATAASILAPPPVCVAASTCAHCERVGGSKVALPSGAAASVVGAGVGGLGGASAAALAAAIAAAAALARSRSIRVVGSLDAVRSASNWSTSCSLRNCSRRSSLSSPAAERASSCARRRSLSAPRMRAMRS